MFVHSAPLTHFHMLSVTSETLARQLQDEENARLHDHYARQDLARLEQERDAERGRAAERERELKERGRQARERTLNAARPKKKSDCIIM